jgi:DNA-binding transcriptional regulator GbsR (MarR family)
VLGALLTHERGLPVDEMAELLDKPVGEVEFTIERLEEEDLCERVVHDGIVRVVGFAAYSSQNSA